MKCIENKVLICVAYFELNISNNPSILMDQSPKRKFYRHKAQVCLCYGFFEIHLKWFNFKAIDVMFTI